MERMIDPNDYESRLWNLLETKRLADLSQYHRPDFLDEVPLYTRETDIDFLPRDPAEANLILLRFSLKFLKSVVAYESHRSGYLAAITVSDFDDTRIVPCLFVWNASLRKIRSQVRLGTRAFGVRQANQATGGRSEASKGFRSAGRHGAGDSSGLPLTRESTLSRLCDLESASQVGAGCDVSVFRRRPRRILAR